MKKNWILIIIGLLVVFFLGRELLAGLILGMIALSLPIIGLIKLILHAIPFAIGVLVVIFIIKALQKKS